MTMKLNGTGESNARGKISSGDYDAESSWSFSSGDGDKLLGPNGDDWTNYGKWHLGQDTTQTEKTKAYYGYPFGKDGKVYESALNAIRQRSSAQNATDIFDAAGRLKDQMDKKEGKEETSDRVLEFPKNKTKGLMKVKPNYKIVASKSGDSAEMFLYDVIGSGWLGGISAEDFSKDLRALGSVRTIDVRINSDGGDVFDGRTIYSLLSQHPANITVYVDGLAASIASLIAMAGNQIIMADGSMMMIHRAWGLTIGNTEDMRKQADLLDMIDQTLLKTYCARTGIDPKKCLQMMKDETWMTAEDCLKDGFADKVIEPQKMAAKVRDLVAAKDGRVVSAADRFHNIPAALRPKRAMVAEETAELKKIFGGGKNGT